MVRNTIKSIKNLLVREQNEILSAAALLMAIGLASKLVGMVYESIRAKIFGTTGPIENFLLASVLPEAITSIILLGAISGSIIPIFSKVAHNEDEEKLNRSFSNVMNVIILVFIVLSFVIVIYSRQLVPLAISISQPRNMPTDAAINEIVWMMRVMLISQVFLGVGALFSTWLNIKQRFVIPQLAPLFLHIGKIIGALIFVPLMNGSVWGLVWGMVLGGFFNVLVQIPLLKYLKFNWNIKLIDFKDIHLKESFKMGLPRMMSLAVEYIAVIVDSLIALSFSSLAVYNYAVRLIAFPLSFGTSFAIASFPSFSKLRAMGKNEEFSKLFFKVINEVIYITLPLVVLFVILRIPIVRLIYGFGGGKWTWNDTLQVAWVVLFFALGAIFESLRSIMFRAYFSVKDTVVPFFSSIFVLVGGIVTGILFSNYFSHFDYFRLNAFTFNPEYFVTKGTGNYGAVGLALSSSLIFSLEFFILLFILWKKKVIIDLKGFMKGLLRKLLVGLIMLVVCYVLAKFWEEVLNTAKTIQLFILTATTSFASFSIYLLLSYVFSVDEVRIFIKLLNKILKVFKINIED
jgi:putative peptidoglycan lipid II flippase